MTMQIVNGFTVIARRVRGGHGGVVILGVRGDESSPSGFQYVVATMASQDDTHWCNGDYRCDIQAAYIAYQHRR